MAVFLRPDPGGSRASRSIIFAYREHFRLMLRPPRPENENLRLSGFSPSVLSRHEWRFLPSAVTWPPFPGGSGKEVSMLIGYARVSNVGAGLDVQKDALDKANVDRLFIDDEASWANAKFPQWELALSLLHKGDTLVVWRLDRLGQGLGRLIRTIEDLGSRSVGFQSLDDSIDTTTGASSHIFAALGQSERSLVQERTAAGLTAARACGRPAGRKPKLTEEQRTQAMTLYYERGLSVDDLCAMFQVAPRTLSRYVHQENKRKAGKKPRAKTAAGLSTNRGRKADENVPQTVDNAEPCPVIACANSSSSTPPPADTDDSLRPAAAAPSRPRLRVLAKRTAA